MTRLIDSHCHLAGLPAEALGETLRRAKEAGVDTLIAIGAGSGFKDNLKTLRIANTHKNIYCTLGMHPHDAKEVKEEHLQSLSKLISRNKTVKAVGEIGLDYHYLNSPKETQQRVLRRFIWLAHEVKMPLVIHDRDTGDACVTILKEENARERGGVAHCFTGSPALARAYLDLGFYISFSGIITFKNAATLREVVKQVPLERMLLETDAPFLAPVPYRGKKNEPAYVKYVAECVVGLKGVSFEEVAMKTTENAIRLFNLTPVPDPNHPGASG